MRIKLALGAAMAFLFAFLPASFAADLGGGCCADLEERVAELEATAARKGNRKVSVVVYGEVSKAYMWESADFGSFRGHPGGSFPSNRGVVDNPNSPTMLGVMGESKLDKNFKAGFRVEIELDARQSFVTDVPGSWNAVTTLRTALFWVDSPIGKVSIGHGAVASDMAGSLSVANTDIASRMLSLGQASTLLLGYDLPFSNVRKDLLRYDSPTVLGFVLSASIANGDSVTPFNFQTPDPNAVTGQSQKQAIDVALRWANEIAGFRAAAAIAYRDDNGSIFAIPTIFGTDNNVIDGSVSIMHMGTGIFGNFAMGQINGIGSSFVNPFGIDLQMWQIQGGWEKNITKYGNTTIFAEYGHLDATANASFGGKRPGSINLELTPAFWGLGAVQAIDQLAMDFYVDYKHYDSSQGTGQICSGSKCASLTPLIPDLTGDVVLAGGRIKF